MFLNASSCAFGEPTEVCSFLYIRPECQRVHGAPSFFVPAPGEYADRYYVDYSPASVDRYYPTTLFTRYRYKSTHYDCAVHPGFYTHAEWEVVQEPWVARMKAQEAQRRYENSWQGSLVRGWQRVKDSWDVLRGRIDLYEED